MDKFGLRRSELSERLL